jgi:hypothetical protein
VEDQEVERAADAEPALVAARPEPLSGVSAHSGDDPARDVIPFPGRPRARRAEAWEGLLRMMKASGLARVEIGIDDVRWAVRAARALPCD